MTPAAKMAKAASTIAACTAECLPERRLAAKKVVARRRAEMAAALKLHAAMSVRRGRCRSESRAAARFVEGAGMGGCVVAVMDANSEPQAGPP